MSPPTRHGPRPTSGQALAAVGVLALCGTAYLLGTLEPEHYGAATLEEILAGLHKTAESAGVELADFQSNAEHELVGAVDGRRARDRSR